MEHRQRVRGHGFRAHAQRAANRHRMRRQVFPGDHRAFGEAGRSRGVDLQEVTFDRPGEPGEPGGRLGVGQPLLVQIVGSAKRNDPFHVRQVRLDLTRDVAELLANDKQPRLRVIDQVAGLLGGEQEADRHKDGACPQARQRGFQVRGAVLVQQCDAVTGSQARRELCGRVPVDPVGELGPRPGSPAVADRLPVRRRLPPVLHERSHVRRQSGLEFLR
jgi:hypothetical protein